MTGMFIIYPHWAAFFIVTLIVSGLAYFWWPDLDFAFALEAAPLAWVQSSLLIACTTLAGVLCVLDDKKTIWLFTCAGLLYAALDEKFMFHETLQSYIRYEWMGNTPLAYQVSHAFTLVYLLFGALAYVWLWKNLCRQAKKWATSALLVGAGAIVLDVLFDSVFIQIFEELSETLAETLFLSCLLIQVGMVACQRNQGIPCLPSNIR